MANPSEADLEQDEDDYETLLLEHTERAYAAEAERLHKRHADSYEARLADQLRGRPFIEPDGDMVLSGTMNLEARLLAVFARGP